MDDKYEGRYFLEDKPDHSYIRGYFESVEEAKRYAIKRGLSWWRVVAYDHIRNCWDVLLTGGNSNEQNQI